MKKIWILPLFILTFLLNACDEDEPIITPSTNVIDENIVVATTLTADKVWVISGYVDINANVVIEPGTVIKFEEGATLGVGYYDFGSLTAIGTLEKPIIFTSAATLPSKGDFVGLQFYEHNSESVSELRYCIFEYAGNAVEPALLLDNTSIKMNYCTITKVFGNGIEAKTDAFFKQFGNNTISDCGKDPIQIEADYVHTIEGTNILTAATGYGIRIVNGGVVKTSSTWYKQSVPYVINGYITIHGDGNTAELTIEAGSVLRFGADAYFEVGYSDQGKLVANGTTLEPIVFTSNSSSPSPGDWEGIMFYDYTSGGSMLNNCEVTYAGAGEWHAGAVALDECGSSVTISNCNISHSNSNGIYVYYSSPILINNVYSDNYGDNVFYE